jgi:hypothetical protein
MSLSKYIVLIWAFLLATAAVAGDRQHTKIAIAVDDDETGEQSFHFDSEEAGFDLHSLAIGESRVWTDESGNVANIMRTTEGFEIDVAGETIILDDLHGDATVDIDTVVKVDDVREIKMIKKGDVDDITIISAEPIDAATRQQIVDTLNASGNDSEVIFIDGSELNAHGESHAREKHEVRIIRKELDVAN